MERDGYAPMRNKYFQILVTDMLLMNYDDVLLLRNGQPMKDVKKFSPSQIPDTSRAGFEYAQNLSSGFVE